MTARDTRSENVQPREPGTEPTNDWLTETCSGLATPGQGDAAEVAEAPPLNAREVAELASYPALVAALGEAYIAGGREKPLLPDGKRDEVIEMLTRIVVNPALREGYVAELQRHQKQFRWEDTGVFEDLPEEAIVETGFTTLSDDTLADIACDPVAIEMVHEMLILKPRSRDEAHDSRQWLVDAFTDDLKLVA